MPKFILMSDLHLRDTPPENRKDDYYLAMHDKLDCIRSLAIEYNAEILDGGDLFHKWKASPWLLGWAIEHLPDHITTVPGNHDLPGHNMANLEKSGLHVLHASGKIEILCTPIPKFVEPNVYIYGVPYKGEIPTPEKQKMSRIS